MALNPRHQAFADEYLANGRNGYLAYIKVYGEKENRNVAEANASRLLSNAKVKEYIEVRSENIAEALGIDFEWLLREQKDIYYMAKHKVYYNLNGEEMGESPDFGNANKALDQLAKLIGAYAPTKSENKHEITDYTFQSDLDA